jgi:hypothetical protein
MPSTSSRICTGVDPPIGADTVQAESVMSRRLTLIHAVDPARTRRPDFGKKLIAQ